MRVRAVNIRVAYVDATSGPVFILIYPVLCIYVKPGFPRYREAPIIPENTDPKSRRQFAGSVQASRGRPPIRNGMGLIAVRMHSDFVVGVR